MALLDRYVGKVTLGMSNRVSSTHSVYLKPQEANLYLVEITQLLKDATGVGQYFLSVQDLSSGVLISKGVELKTVDDAADYPAATAKIWAWDKLSVQFHAGFNNYNVTIPGRNNANYNIGEDGVSVVSAGAGASTQVTQYVTRFNAVVYSKEGDAAVFDKMYVSQ